MSSMVPPVSAATHRRGFIRSRGVLLVSVLAATSAAAAGWVVFGSHRPADGKETAVAAVAEARPSVAPDPRFVRREMPSLTVDLSPEARRMVLAMQNSFDPGHHHAGEEEAPILLPGLDGKSSGDSAAQAPALLKSLGSLPDERYVAVALPKILDRETPQPLRDVLFDDLRRRPDPIKLRTLFVLGGTEGHPLADAAREQLASTLNVDFQSDWPRWEQAVIAQSTREERGMRSNSCRSH